MDLSDPIQALELAFHSDDKWYQVTKFFNRGEVDLIRQRLQNLPAPIGELFGHNPDTARVALVSLVVLSQHAECPGFESPGRRLPILSPALAPYVDCPAAAVSEAPSWFIEQEVPRFESLVESSGVGSIVLKFPKAIEIATGRVVHEWNHLRSGQQLGSIDQGDPPPPPIALDASNGRFAIAGANQITVVSLEAA